MTPHGIISSQPTVELLAKVSVQLQMAQPTFFRSQHLILWTNQTTVQLNYVHQYTCNVEINNISSELLHHYMSCNRYITLAVILSPVRIPQCEVNMLQHDSIYPVDCVYMDIQGDTVHLQVPLGECMLCKMFVIRIEIWISHEKYFDRYVQ